MSDECPVVNTNCGKLIGRVCLKAKASEAKQVYNYAGVPFAKPPVGQLRFEPPQKCESWDGVLSCSKLPPAAMQDTEAFRSVWQYFPIANPFDDDLTKIDEDCLYLNIFTSSPSKAANMPVLVWFHGGANQMHSIAGYDGQVLCGLNDVVLVTVGYRLNVFGFFTAGIESDYPGNVGLLDQVAALEWTRDNIRNFGGNPDNVTLFGQSGGAGNVGLHLASPLSRGLFHKTIQHSGACLGAAVKKSYERITEKFLNELKIEERDPKIYMPKLKALPVNEIVEAIKTVGMEYAEAYYTTIDGKFLTEMTDDLFEQGNVAQVPSIIGINSTEYAGLFMIGLQPNFSEEEFDQFAKPRIAIFAGDKDDKKDELYKKLKEVYAADYSNDEPSKWQKVAADMLADCYFVFSITKLALLLKKNNRPVYFYEMNYKLRLYHDQDYSGGLLQKSDQCECDHGDDIVFTFGFPMMNGKFEQDVKFAEDEEEFSRIWMTYLCNFASTGDPNKGKQVPCQWRDFTEDTHRRLQPGAQILESKNKLFDSKKYKLWNEDIPLLLKN
ncbi:cocaine esterase-like [Clavelina lepadiformis]|uniref:cocaine esterase-like n=1 Tax=Clavelina lepadiformis TaxID=159417 RepID=UPI004042B070